MQDIQNSTINGASMWLHFVLIYEPYTAEPSIPSAPGMNVLMWY